MPGDYGTIPGIGGPTSDNQELTVKKGWVASAEKAENAKSILEWMGYDPNKKKKMTTGGPGVTINISPGEVVFNEEQVRRMEEMGLDPRKELSPGSEHNKQYLPMGANAKKGGRTKSIFPTLFNQNNNLNSHYDDGGPTNLKPMGINDPPLIPFGSTNEEFPNYNLIHPKYMTNPNLPYRSPNTGPQAVEGGGDPNIYKEYPKPGYGDFKDGEGNISLGRARNQIHRGPGGLFADSKGTEKYTTDYYSKQRWKDEVEQQRPRLQLNKLGDLYNTGNEGGVGPNTTPLSVAKNTEYDLDENGEPYITDEYDQGSPTPETVATTTPDPATTVTVDPSGTGTPPGTSGVPGVPPSGGGAGGSPGVAEDPNDPGMAMNVGGKDRKPGMYRDEYGNVYQVGKTGKIRYKQNVSPTSAEEFEKIEEFGGDIAPHMDLDKEWSDQDPEDLEKSGVTLSPYSPEKEKLPPLGLDPDAEHIKRLQEKLRKTKTGSDLAHGLALLNNLMSKGPELDPVSRATTANVTPDTDHMRRKLKAEAIRTSSGMIKKGTETGRLSEVAAGVDANLNTKNLEIESNIAAIENEAQAKNVAAENLSNREYEKAKQDANWKQTIATSKHLTELGRTSSDTLTSLLSSNQANLKNKGYVSRLMADRDNTRMSAEYKTLNMSELVKGHDYVSPDQYRRMSKEDQKALLERYGPGSVS